MAPKLYASMKNPGTRAILMVAEEIGLELEVHEVDMANSEHLKPEYLKINPQHTVPALTDGDFSIWDSHVINTYLIGTYADTFELYPKNVFERAHIDQRLHFDSGVLFPRLVDLIVPMIQGKTKTPYREAIDAVHEALGHLEIFLEENKFFIGDFMTVADITLCTTLNSLELYFPIAVNKYPKLTSWFTTMKSLPYYESCNKAGLNQFSKLVKK